jgi:hypothetical protein
MGKRKRVRQVKSLVERLRQFADEARAAAERLPEGEERKQLMLKVEATEKAITLEGYLASPELKPPK